MSQQTITFMVSGMTCNHCKTFIINTLKESSGVEGVEVDLESGKTTVKYDSRGTNAQILLKTVNDSGIYTANLIN